MNCVKVSCLCFKLDVCMYVCMYVRTYYMNVSYVFSSLKSLTSIYTDNISILKLQKVDNNRPRQIISPFLSSIFCSQVVHV